MARNALKLLAYYLPFVILILAIPYVSGENETPNVTIDEPDMNSIVNGIILIKGTATDDISIEKVQVQFEDYGWQKADGTNVWHKEIDTKYFGYGNLTIYVRATDGIAFSEIESIMVLVDNPPSITMQDPTLWYQSESYLSVGGSAKDDRWPTKVEIRIDQGDWIEEPPQYGGYIFPITWYHAINRSSMEYGNHTIEVRAYDGYQYSNIIRGTFFTDRPPEIFLDHPINGSKFIDKMLINGTSSDDAQVERVEFRIDDGNWSIVDGSTRWHYEVVLSEYDNGEHILEVRSYDGGQFSDIVSIYFIVKSPEESPGFLIPGVFIAFFFATLAFGYRNIKLR